MKLIDVDIFESVLDFADADVCEESPDGHCDFGFSRENIRELLQDIPAIDAVPVVRCRECKHYDTADFDGNILCGCTLHSAMLDITPDSFCYYGERKEGADNEP